MSHQSNDLWAERLFERLEELEPAMNLPQYAELQSDLLRMLSRGEFYEAQDQVVKWEQDYSGVLADMQSRDKQELEAEYAS